jgi:uncharacterized protein (TIGR00255 family)
MIKSMTGYGSAKGNAAGFEISVELKSVNNRYLETSVRMPRSFLFAEEAVKSTVQRHISRGKVDVFVSINAVSVDDVKVSVNEPLLRGYLEAVKKVSEEYGLNNDLTALSAVRFPDVLLVERSDLDAEAVSAGICSVLEEALKDFDAMREREGIKLRDDVLSRLETISGYVSRVETEAPQTVEHYRQRLEKKMAEVLGTAGIDEDRILAEAALYADHIAVDEETVRLRSHMAQLDGMIRGKSPIGRKIDFLVQEFNREANTIGSKCQNSELAHVVVDLKSEIEKIREQIQNIE